MSEFSGTTYRDVARPAVISATKLLGQVMFLVAIALGWLILDEGISSTTLIGAGIIVASVALVVRAEART